MRELFREAALLSYPQLAKLGRLSRRERLDELFESSMAQGMAWVLCQEDERLAMAMIEPGHHPLSETREWILSAIAVGPEHRGKGLGKVLLRHVQAEARAHGVPELRLFVAHDNAPALRLYQALGFGPGTQEWSWPAGDQA